MSHIIILLFRVFRFSSPQIEIRALIEGQMLHRRMVATDMGFNFNTNTKLVATGGASINKSILQVIADVFNAPVFVQVSVSFRMRSCFE